MKTWLKRTLIGVGFVVAAGAGTGAVLYVASAPQTPTVSDIPYGSAVAQRFDVWTPPGAGPFPVVLTVHGGAFKFGDKFSHDGLKANIDVLLSHGIAVASTNYRMSGEAKFPAAAQDVSAALAELRRRAPSLKLDPARVALWGKSAGANLALLVGLSQGRPPIGTGSTAPVAAIVAMYPPTRFDVMDEQLRASPCGTSAANHDATDSPESVWLGAPLRSRPDLVAASSPLSYVRRESPQVLVQAGLADCMVPHEQSMMLAMALKKAGAPVTLNLVPGAGHIDPVFDQPANLAVVVAFLEKALAPSKNRNSNLKSEH